MPVRSWFPEKKGTHHVQNNTGAIAVEFALVAPIFFLLLFATIELGIYLHDRQVLANAAREAARFGIVMQNPRPGPTQIQQKALDFSNTLIGVSLDCTPGATCPDIQVDFPNGVLPGRPLSVTIATPFPFPLVSSFTNFSPSIPVGGASTMILE